MKSIIYLTKSFPHKSETFIVNQITAAIEKGFDVGILTYNYLKPSNSSQEDLFSKYKLHQRVNAIDYNIPTNIFLKLLSLVKLNFLFYNYIIKAKNLSFRKRYTLLPFQIQFFKKFKKTDTFHIHFGHASFDIIKLKSLGVIQSKVIITFHGIDAHWLDDVEYNAKKKQYSEVFKYADLITVNSNYLNEKLKKLGCPKNKVIIIPMGVDVNYFKANINYSQHEEGTITLLSIGRLIELKGHEYAIMSISELVKQGYKVKYNIVGNGKLYDKLDNLITRLGIEDSIKLLGHRDQIEIKNLLEKTDIFLMPSTVDITGRAEAQGQVTAEAQSMGVPVVAFNSGGIKDTIIESKTGFLVEDKDIASFSKAIKILIDNEGLRKEMGKNAEEFVRQRFNLKTNMDLIFNNY
ncbi:hypothetical protein BWZ20_04225 [Winogradskyella sp. J14-2]|uniref:glycosyltransferase n=1 Tax=Winogradskyella sp. J14-2 TaxID=1936080 RepID=UPI000972C689|nr:glycosyltransferase [Winogradskyella sp. J14-2]APY07550.1 hypothetical protein BWZ20_04225 [Winogradskyella sp. J14-2]